MTLVDAEERAIIIIQSNHNYNVYLNFLFVFLQLIQLGRDTYEFKEVARLYDRTMDHPIKSIQRIQNLDLWEFFCR